MDSDTFNTVHVKIHNYDEEYHNIQVSFSSDNFVEPEGQETLYAYDIGSFRGDTMESIIKELSIMGYYQIKRMKDKSISLQNTDLINSIKDNVGTKIPNQVGHLEAKLAITLPGYALNQTLVDMIPNFEIEDKSL
jgi:hypothetical protein